jgi:hypothetical protein
MGVALWCPSIWLLSWDVFLVMTQAWCEITTAQQNELAASELSGHNFSEHLYLHEKIGRT